MIEINPPQFLYNYDENSRYCLFCKCELIKEETSEKGYIRISEECYGCRYQDRPFGHLSRHSECTCEYKLCDYTKIILTCNRCINNR